MGRERVMGLAWLAVGMIAGSGCATAYEPERMTPHDVRPAEAGPAAIAYQPGCPEPTHQPFPTTKYVEELPEAMTKVPPTYPDDLKGFVGGTVLVQALVCEHGRVMKTTIAKSIPMLDEAAREAVMRWTFKPALSGGQPIPVSVAVPVRFEVR